MKSTCLLVLGKIDGKLVIKDLPESLWSKTDIEQFQWLDNQLPNGVRSEGYTWHHSEVSGKMELVEFGVHNSTWYKGEGHQKIGLMHLDKYF